ncbi:MAG TPA: GNAT family N-acetyltransferase, partial [Egibacteraceae bacterium]|nr:GNAT family N-acetyltransferase [Egibacteraceae bacterium]
RSWVWERGGEVVAHWAAVSVPLVLDGRPAVGVKTADAATHPDHRRQGLFATLALRYMQDLRERGIPAVLTHPNPDSAAGVEASGPVLVERLPAYVLAVDDAWLARRFHVPASVSRLVRRAAFPAPGAGGQEVAAPPEGLDALWSGLGERWGVRRDAAWWRWRYQAHPAARYRFAEVRRGGALRAAAAVRVQEAFGGRFAYVMEFLAADQEAAGALTGTLADLAREQGAAGLVVVTTSWSRTAALVRGAGFRRLPRRLEPNPLRFLVAEPGGDSAGLARQRWSAAWGDLDHL